LTSLADGIRTTALSRRFGGGAGVVVHAVEDVSLAVPRGQLLAVMGPSGSGKTTLLSLVGGLLAPTAGSVVLDGVRLDTLSQSELTAFRLKRIGFVFQTFQLIDALSAAENVELAQNLAGIRRPASSLRAAALIGRLGLAPRAAFATGTLSGGEKQRVAIARALANDPPVILADEPTGSLDSHAGQEVIELLHDLAHHDGKSVLVVSHDVRIERFADQVVRIEDGRVK
jgi:putative ABC transport system ATP-binding protein